MSDKFKIDPSVFKAYDIRGVVPEQINVDSAEQIARAFVDEVKPTEVVVGRDARLTGPDFMKAVFKGLTESGVNVVNIGQVSTDEFYYACGSKNLPGIMITASHNPPEYNGFKMVKEMPYFVMAKEFAPKVLEGEYSNSDRLGAVTGISVTDDFIDHMLSIVSPKKIKPLKVVIDTSNGAMGPVWRKLGSRLPIEIIELCFEPDGNFPNHGNDIVQLENQEMLREKVKETHADLGLIFD